MERNKRENILSLPKYPPENTIPVTPSSGGTSSPIRTTPYPYPSQQSQTVDERLKSAIDQRVAEIKDKINKEVATEKRTISAGVVPSKSKFDPAKNNKTESKVGLEVKIIGMKALCRTTETVLKEVLLKNIKNNLF
jgi:hypothetical protein